MARFKIQETQLKIKSLYPTLTCIIVNANRTLQHCICSILNSSTFSRLYMKMLNNLKYSERLILLMFYRNASFHLQNFWPAFIFVGLCVVLDVLLKGALCLDPFASNKHPVISKSQYADA